MNIFEKFGITEEDLLTLPVGKEYLKWQLELFESGIPALQITSPASLENGIKKGEEIEADNDFDIVDKAGNNGRISLFIPASGAASRMFRKLELYNSGNKHVTLEYLKENASAGDKNAKYILQFVENIKNFPFYEDLAKFLDTRGTSAEELINTGRINELIEFVIKEPGLGLSLRPKGSIKFHKYSDDEYRTPFHEHVYEALQYMKDSRGNLALHFTVSPEHRVIFRNLYQEIKNSDRMKGVNLDVSFSTQKKATDTIAINLDNKALRDEDGTIMFRPGGHGALLENLNDLGADIVVIKNVDNVSPDHLKELNIRYKKILLKYLLDIEQKIFASLEILHSEKISARLFEDLKKFCIDELNLKCQLPSADTPTDEKAMFYSKLLNRPIRVCGMVKNEGDPGGGPFWVKDEDGESLQIVEASQINTGESGQKKLMEQSTFFNPVELVCSLRNFRGKNFNLPEFSDKNTAFISKKSKNGVDLWALELPGLWNGSMAKWTTLFVEIPKATFNPVKEVNDLLKPSHRC